METVVSLQMAFYALKGAEHLISSPPMDGFRFYADSFPLIFHSDHKDADYFPTQHQHFAIRFGFLYRLWLLNCFKMVLLDVSHEEDIEDGDVLRSDNDKYSFVSLEQMGESEDAVHKDTNIEGRKQDDEEEEAERNHC
ncbi:hypothetical protein F3Y22_tig00010204pilonHSYRG00013 [Hibiscus syriacus]|uniref:Uncharacterized protein n=1 Tax=Hibiscus syriacus TaxID=106335 RepID=A0A6A3CAT9_HIBSY|nr:hypothetical protein F3Y22_tig00010204pilonHSYRG00013 [Hibiscus syriacus]